MSLGAKGKNQEKSFHVLLQTPCCYTQGYRQQMLVFVNVSYQEEKICSGDIRKRELQSCVVVD